MNYNLHKRWAKYFDSVGIICKYNSSPNPHFILYFKLKKIIVHLEHHNTNQPCNIIDQNIDIDPCYGLVIGKYHDHSPMIINNCDRCVAISLFVHLKCINCNSQPEYTKNKKIVKLLKNLWEYNDVLDQDQ